MFIKDRSGAALVTVIIIGFIACFIVAGLFLVGVFKEESTVTKVKIAADLSYAEGGASYGLAWIRHRLGVELSNTISNTDWWEVKKDLGDYVATNSGKGVQDFLVKYTGFTKGEGYIAQVTLPIPTSDPDLSILYDKCKPVLITATPSGPPQKITENEYHFPYSCTIEATSTDGKQKVILSFAKLKTKVWSKCANVECGEKGGHKQGCNMGMGMGGGCGCKCSKCGGETFVFTSETYDINVSPEVEIDKARPKWIY